MAPRSRPFTRPTSSSTSFRPTPGAGSSTTLRRCPLMSTVRSSALISTCASAPPASRASGCGPKRSSIRSPRFSRPSTAARSRPTTTSSRDRDNAAPVTGRPLLAIDDAAPDGLLHHDRADEQVFRLFAVAQYLGIDERALVQVEPEPGEVLETEVAIAVDSRVAQPFLEIGRAAGVGRKQNERGIEADVLERLGHRRVLGSPQALLDGVDVDLRRFDLAE